MQPGPCLCCHTELCSPSSLCTSFVISAQHYMFIWHSSHCLSRTLNPCIFPSKLEHLAVELYSSTFLKTQTVKTWSILSQGVFYWLEWGHHSQKLVRLFWHSRQLANIHSPSFSLYATRSAYGGVWERWAGKIIVKMLLETRPSSGVSSTALKSEDKGQTHTRSPSLHCKFSWRESESAILWKSAGVCQ